MSDNFELPIQELPKELPQTGQYLKNQKEIKIGNGSFYVDSSGNLEIRDSSGVLTTKIDNTGVYTVYDSAGVARYSVDNTGKMTIKDSSGNTVILIDPNG